MAHCPDIGDIVWINFDPQEGTEQWGRRPALVLSPRSYNQRSRLCVLCPITNQVKGYPFEVPIPAGHKVTGAVLADQVKSQSWEMRDAELIAAAPPAVLATAKGLIKALLRIP
ncbi:MAG TPA: type II toxin-antitoxin system PemK/MazF family toxin [Stellaceae bacterium]|nr:type II toxin-antitoxin system PemK/MazF family toxin [Stellaceae bacterium]